MSRFSLGTFNVYRVDEVDVAKETERNQATVWHAGVKFAQPLRKKIISALQSNHFSKISVDMNEENIKGKNAQLT